MPRVDHHASGLSARAKKAAQFFRRAKKYRVFLPVGQIINDLRGFKAKHSRESAVNCGLSQDVATAHRARGPNGDNVTPVTNATLLSTIMTVRSAFGSQPNVRL